MMLILYIDRNYELISNSWIFPKISTNKEKHWRLGSEDPNDTLVFDFSEMESALLMLESCTAGRKHSMEIVEKNMREAEPPSIG